MMIRKTIRLLLNVFFLFLATNTFAQENHFIYLQTDNGQPFYVKLHNQLYSSSLSGYIILPKLSEGDYQLVIGFPGNEHPEEEFQVSVGNQNMGFLLKSLQNNLVLFNLETLALLEANKKEQPVKDTVVKRGEVIKSDPFSSLLAEVVKDSSILKSNPLAASATPAEETQLQTKKNDIADSKAGVKNVDTNDSSIVAMVDAAVAGSDAQGTNQPAEKVEVKEPQSTDAAISKIAVADSASPISGRQPVKNISVIQHQEVNEKDTLSGNNVVGAEAYDTLRNTNGHIVPVDSLKNVLSPFKRILLVNEKGGRDMVYVNENTKDTIRLFMPVEEISVQHLPEVKPKDSIIFTPENTADHNLANTPATTVSIVRDAEKDSGAIVADSRRGKRGDTARQARIIYNPDGGGAKEKQVSDKKEQQGNGYVNADCTSLAGEREFLRLRKKMAGENDNLKMIDVARRFFKLNCYTTEQIRNLSYLFMDDEGRYQFFDVAYPYTSDANQFHTLETQLKDPYYVKRFKAMLHK